MHSGPAFGAESVDVNIWHFTAEHGPTTVELMPAYDYKFGWIAGLLAMAGGYALFPAIEPVRGAHGASARRLWLAGGALTMSIGLWGMHWMAMVGFQLPTSYSAMTHGSVWPRCCRQRLVALPRSMCSRPHRQPPHACSPAPQYSAPA